MLLDVVGATLFALLIHVATIDLKHSFPNHIVFILDKPCPVAAYQYYCIFLPIRMHVTLF